MNQSQSPYIAIPLLRVHHQNLSLWQSIVIQFVRELNREKEPSLPIHHPKIQGHPMAIAVNQQVAEDEKHAHNRTRPKLSGPENPDDPASIHLFLSRIAFRIAEAKSRGNEALANSYFEFYRKYSNNDPGFLTCITTYNDYKKKWGGVMKYNAWTDNGGMQFGVMDYKVPNDAKVGIIGDWGTGMPDAENLLLTLMNSHHPDVLIHLGDIYYSGTPTECEDNFALIFDRVFSKYGKRVPVFTIPGNHDYYAFGHGYYQMVSKLNQGIKGATQNSSFFCLRTEDSGWQFLGMDTGLGDSSPYNVGKTWMSGPDLQPSEIEWHRNKLDHFSGATILLSHHQVFSANARINGKESTFSGYPNVNKYLLDTFRPYFGKKVAAWLWGHEHNQVIYENGLFGIPAGRLIGASAYEESKGDDPYALTFPNAPMQPGNRLGISYGYYNHGYAIIDLSGRKSPSDAVKISYYEYPSWGETAPNPVPTTSKFINSESLYLQAPQRGKLITYNTPIHLNLEQAREWVGPIDHVYQYFPTLGQTPVQLQILGQGGTVKNGDIIRIRTLEPKAGEYNVLGAWSTSALYYYKSGGKQPYHQEYFIIRKVIPSGDSEIREGDAVQLISRYYPGQYLCPYKELSSSYTFLSTDAAVPATWFIEVAD